MAKLLSLLNRVIFPMEADELTIAVNGDERNESGLYPVKLTVTDPSSGDEQTLIDTDFVANDDGEVELDDMGGFINDYLEKSPMVLSLYVKGTGVALTSEEGKPCVVLPCRVSMEMTAEDFCREYFLSLSEKVFSTKYTYDQALEYLSAYIGPDEATPVPSISLTCRMIDADLMDTSDVEVKMDPLTFDDGLQTGHIVTLNVSMNTLVKYIPAGAELVSYRVTLGSRCQHYVVRGDSALTEPHTLMFANCFGQVDSYNFFGAQEKELKPSYSAAYVKGKKRNYYIEAVPTWTLHDRPEYGLGLFEDLATSKYVCRLPYVTEVVITECDIKDPGVNSEPYSVSISVQESARRLKFAFPRKTRSFDKTFDRTFD